MKDFDFENDSIIENENTNGRESEPVSEAVAEPADADLSAESEAVPAAAAEPAEEAPATVQEAAENADPVIPQAVDYSEDKTAENANANKPSPYPGWGTYPQYAQAPQYAQTPRYAQAPQYAQTPQYAQAPQVPQNPQAVPDMNAQSPRYAQYTPAPQSRQNSYTPYPQTQMPRQEGASYGTSAQSGGVNANPYKEQAYNAYAAGARASYDDMRGGISYEPDKRKAKKEKKEKKPLGVRAVAAICAVCVLLSGLCGFGGSLLANRLSKGTAETSSSQVQQSAAVSASGDPVVIYKSVDDVATSTSATAGSDLTYAQVAAMVKDSVVEINTEYTTRNSWFQYNTQGAGSGVVISEDGYIITNAHVILDENMVNVADTVTVRLTNGEEYPAQVKVFDSEEDIAIMKIDATGLTPVLCGDSSRMVVGEELVIVGNPLGELGGSVSNGIVSATEREIQVGGVTMHLIQTNAAVNPGNSGGGMFNMKGELVGIVNAKSSGTGIEGLGFAIPINQALSVSEQLLTYGYVRGKPMIGVSFTDVSGSNYFFYYNVKAGVYVSGLTEGMNDNVLKEGDRIIAVNGEEISSSEDIKAIVYSSAIGDKLTFQLYRDNKLMEVEVTCYERVPDGKDSSISFGSQEIPGSLDDFFGG